MNKRILWAAPFVLALSYGCGSGSNSTTASNTGAGAGSSVGGAGGAGGNAMLSDSDGDGISDLDEKAADKVDSDKDGTPDYLDSDSDDDGIPDSVEAGDSNLSSPPVDSDGDKIPDFLDDDSDDNGILDADEGVEDGDSDGIGDYADLDNDGDLSNDSLEIVGEGSDCDGDQMPDPTGDPKAPADCDGDGTPNYMDTDSDNDTISDKDEGIVDDTDSDGARDRYELDSDNDGFTDAEEAGDSDLATAPVDTDTDTIPDFRDPDSDQDGLSDAKEKELMTDPTQADSDGDGVSDLIETAAGTDPNQKADNPQAKGDFVFVVPYDDTTTPADDTLEFRTNVQFADIYFLFDQTGSMGAEFSAMKNAATGVPKIIADLTCSDTQNPCNIDSDCGANEICFFATKTCVENPNTANNGDGCIPDMWTGVGRYGNCNTYINSQHLQPDPSLTASKIGGTGSGSAEPVVQAPGCVADPSLCSNNNQCSAHASNSTPVGCPGYRPDAVRILVSITDADNQGGTCGNNNISIANVGAKLKQQGIKFVGLYGTGDDGSGTLCTTPKDCAEKLGVAAGTVDTNNKPFAYPALDAQVTSATKKAIMDIVRGVPLNVTIEATDAPNDAGDALQFIDYLEVNVSGQGQCTMVSPTADTDADTRDDSFPALLGGTPVCWNVQPVDKQKTVMPTAEPQVFIAKLTVKGDNSPLDERRVFFLVPPKAAVVPTEPR